MKLSTFRKAVVAIGLAVTLGVAGPARAGEQENISGKGILAHAGALLLLGDVMSCGSSEQLPAAQVFVSTDAGKTWQKHGPALEGSEFEFSSSTAAGIWLAGIHIAEGPGMDPFLWRPSDKPYEWIQSTIFEGPASLEGVAMRQGTMFAWVRHIDVHEPDKPAPLYLHRSTDGGRSWKESGPVKSVAEKSATKFRKIRTRSGSWRLTEDSAGFSIQHQQNSKEEWQQVSRFERQDCKIE